jgi:hypothetical protein
MDTLYAPGEHAAIFGERGVGKTSLAAIGEAMCAMGGGLPVRVNCQANDLVPDLWRRVGETLDRNMRVDSGRGKDVSDIQGLVPGAVAMLTSPSVGTNEVLTSLEMLGTAREVVLFLDEFDRIGDGRIHTEIVDLMKTISDQAVKVTLVVVGVASDVDTLMDEHESIGRGLNEIEMPRMSTIELKEVISRGLAHAEMQAEDEAAEFVAQLSIGLPHYTHLMGLQAGLRAVSDEKATVDIHHVLEGLDASLSRAQQHITRLYHGATHSTQSNMYRQVLLAAALASADDRGYFAPGDLRDPLEVIMGRRYEIPAFANHLSQFADERGPILEKSGRERRPRYRFTEPLLVPYISMRGVSERLIEPRQMRQMLTRRLSR